MEETTTRITKLEDMLHVQARLLALKPDLEKGKVFECVIKPFRRKRSLDANAYCWRLCDEIAANVKDTTKIEIYRDAIRNVGVHALVLIPKAGAELYMRAWGKNGLGSFAELVGEHDDQSEIMTYFGSSNYDTKEMARLIDWVVGEAKQLGIQTMTPDEIANMKSLWGAA